MPSLDTHRIRARLGAREILAISLAVLLLAWGAALLALYPGCVTDDGLDIIHMVLGLPQRTDAFRYDGWSNHHPALYALAIKGAIAGVRALGLGYGAALAAVAAGHMVVLAVSCALACAWIRRETGSLAAAGAALAFFALDPVLAKTSVTIWKDIPFAGLLVAYCLAVHALLAPSCAPGAREAVPAVALGLCCALLRNNGLVAVLCPLVLGTIASPRSRRALAASAACVVAVYALVTGPGYALAGVRPGHLAETLGLPIQQVGRVYAEGGDILEADRAVFEEILPAEGWAAGYNPGSANGIKFSPDFDDAYLEAHATGFLRAWARTGLANKGAYGRAWAEQTAAFWRIDPSSRIWTAASRDVELAGTAVLARPKLLGEGVRAALEASVTWSIEHLAPLYNQALLCWLCALGVAVAALRGRRAEALALSPLVALWGTLLVAAPSSDFRYALPMLVALPVIAVIALSRGNRFGAGEPVGNARRAGRGNRATGAHFKQIVGAEETGRDA